jgi:lipopolysaccharide/colanic/teichoic acid biosynthesis glycosyltransferase
MAMQSSLHISDRVRNPNDSKGLGFQPDTLRKGFYIRFGKRAFDFVFSAIGLLILTPLFAVVAMCIKLTSRGEVFFRQTRVGRDGHPFQIVKFRSMLEMASRTPPGITVSSDTRITRVGGILRRYKIDELPQLWNVFLGDMSFVGPRPELPKFVEGYSVDQRQVLGVRPGITDPASLAYRHEEEILSDSQDPEEIYRTEILPDKLSRNLSYIKEISLWNDVRIIFVTLAHSFLFVRKNPMRVEK